MRENKHIHVVENKLETISSTNLGGSCGSCWSLRGIGVGQLPNDGQDGADRLLGSDHEVRRGASCSGCRKQQHIKMGAE
ncbi:hypothetical protein TRIUR3_31637 [Triticum urartu]|uniref:Uncharacterized protein n=1 Tax=Triticum urartu TaxID=4572 RepID=M8AT37_TRIUA|nr:hypothetical protein TRIUR3_31637 [Triticum urartu]